LKFAPGAIWLPNPISTEGFRQANPKGMVVVHAPFNNPISKGTQYVLDAIPEVKEAYPLAELDVVSGMAYQDALKRYSRASIGIDQLVVGWYGMFALECMAMRIPVMCYIRRDLEKHLGTSKPLYELSLHGVEHLAENIITLLGSPEYQKALIEYGWEYVDTVHNPATIAKQISDALEK
jgi:hypothetical protein